MTGVQTCALPICPNVGKSTLFNRLIGEDRAVVHDMPGTTRDAVDTPVSFRDTPYLLIDTAGIRRKGKVSEALEKLAVVMALKSLERCQVAGIPVLRYSKPAEWMLDENRIEHRANAEPAASISSPSVRPVTVNASRCNKGLSSRNRVVMPPAAWKCSM